MSVTVDVFPKLRPYPNPQNNPFLPVAIWYGQGGITGDAGGGFMEVRIVLNANGPTRSGRSWSIETSIPRLSANAQGTNVIFNSENMDNIGPGLNNPIQKSFVVSMIGNNAGHEAPESTVLVSEMHPHLFLGSQGSSDSDAAIRVQAQNLGAAQILGWFAEGYIWSPEIINIGALKPIDGLLGG